MPGASVARVVLRVVASDVVAMACVDTSLDKPIYVYVSQLLQAWVVCRVCPTSLQPEFLMLLVVSYLACFVPGVPALVPTTDCSRGAGAWPTADCFVFFMITLV